MANDFSRYASSAATRTVNLPVTHEAQSKLETQRAAVGAALSALTLGAALAGCNASHTYDLNGNLFGATFAKSLTTDLWPDQVNSLRQFEQEIDGRKVQVIAKRIRNGHYDPDVIARAALYAAQKDPSFEQKSEILTIIVKNAPSLRDQGYITEDSDPAQQTDAVVKSLFKLIQDGYTAPQITIPADPVLAHNLEQVMKSTKYTDNRLAHNMKPDR